MEILSGSPNSKLFVQVNDNGIKEVTVSIQSGWKFSLDLSEIDALSLIDVIKEELRIYHESRIDKLSGVN